MGLSHEWVTPSFPPWQGGYQKPPVPMCPHRHFRVGSASSFTAQPTVDGDSGSRAGVNYERGCCLSLKHLERFDVTEKPNWSQHTRAGKGRKVCQRLLSVTCSHSTCAGTGAGLVPPVHICASDAVLGHFLLNSHSSQTPVSVTRL